MEPPRIHAFGNLVYVEFCDGIEAECNVRVHNLDEALRKGSPGWLVESVPTYAALSVSYDPRRAEYQEVLGRLEELSAEALAEPTRVGRLVEVPVRYGGDNGPDLAAVAKLSELTEDEVIEIHASRVYRCYMLGFMPGFVYLGELDSRIVAPRLATPRTRVAAGSVGLAGRQTGFYGIESPGGWQIIGKTSTNQFDVSRTPPSTVLPGDSVRFVAEEGWR